MSSLLLQALPGFLLVFCRITAFFVTAPLISMRSVPAPFRIGIAFFMTLFTFMSIEVQFMEIDAAYILMVLREVLIGVLLGFVAFMFFTVIQISGSFVDMQMGFGVANVIDPMTGMQSPLVGNFKYFLALLIFLSLDGHHYLLTAIMNSYEWVPLDNMFFARIYEGSISSFLLRTLSTMFVLAFQLTAPMIVAIFLVDLGLGMLARTAPQFNVFILGLPLKNMVGFLILLVMIPGLLYLFQQLFSRMFEAVGEILMIIQG
jgi:flagellar biosynthetic protein FliR